VCRSLDLPSDQIRSNTDAEFNRLCRNALGSKKLFCYLDGLDRYWVDRIADATGYRARELASITPAGCHLDGDAPFISVDCTISKRREHERQYIKPDLAAGFREFIKDHNRSELIWPNGWYLKATKMMMIDLDGIELETEVGRLGMHALRHTHISNVVHFTAREGISNREVMEQCHLSSETLLATYAHNDDQNLDRLVAGTQRQVDFERDGDGMESL
jgi:integrase